MPSPVQSNCDAHNTIANGQYGAVWSMGHTQQLLKACAQYFYSKSSHGLMHVSLPQASLLPDAVLHPPVLPSGHSEVFQYREDWPLARRFPYFAVCRPTYGCR
ncbi:uncharacterized protein TNCV_1595611 [Trichonephila clavipes]|nr:uncharacterized protein TNCV_1595611 [Trichonephila clavipes]